MNILAAIDKLTEDQERRNAWLFAAAEQCRQWREEDRLNEESNRRPAEQAATGEKHGRG